MAIHTRRRQFIAKLAAGSALVLALAGPADASVFSFIQTPIPPGGGYFVAGGEALSFPAFSLAVDDVMISYFAQAGSMATGTFTFNTVVTGESASGFEMLSGNGMIG